MTRTTEELLKDADRVTKELLGYGFYKALIAELSAKLRESDRWRKYYEKESEERGWRLDSYGRRLTAIKEAYYSEDVPPEFTPPKKED